MDPRYAYQLLAMRQRLRVQRGGLADGLLVQLCRGLEIAFMMPLRLQQRHSRRSGAEQRGERLGEELHHVKAGHPCRWTK